MKITNIGGATAILEHKGKRMLFDPWLDDGIFHGSWFHFPPSKIGIEDMGHLDYVYISHIHEDHCSAGTIKFINPDAEIILMARELNYVDKFLKTYGFKFKKVHLVPPRTPTRLSEELWIDMVEPDPANEIAFLIDSSVVIKWDDFIIYNANDCQLHHGGIKYLKENYRKINLALLPYSGGSGYPSCYINLTHEEKINEKARICRQRLNAFMESVLALQPDWVMPFADQYVVAGSRSHLNQYISHHSSRKEIVKALDQVGLRDRGLLLNSGQSFDFEKKGLDPEIPFQDFTEEDREVYIEASLKNKVYDYEKIEFSPMVPLDRLVAYARARLWKMQQHHQYFPEFSYYLDVPEKKLRFQILLSDEVSRAVEWEKPLREPYLRMIGPHSLMVMILLGHISWNIADAALFLDYERIPNIYNTQVHAYLNYLRV
jgi:UDP-MurNAc hydroxylase